jgi:hypothetical protein
MRPLETFYKINCDGEIISICPSACGASENIYAH